MAVHIHDPAARANRMRELIRMYKIFTDVMDRISNVGHEVQNKYPAVSDASLTLINNLRVERELILMDVRSIIIEDFTERMNNSSDIDSLRELWSNVTQELPF